MNEFLKQAIWIYVLLLQAALGLTLALAVWVVADLLRGQTKEPKINNK